MMLKDSTRAVGTIRAQSDSIQMFRNATALSSIRSRCDAVSSDRELKPSVKFLGDFDR